MILVTLNVQIPFIRIMMPSTKIRFVFNVIGIVLSVIRLDVLNVLIHIK